MEAPCPRHLLGRMVHWAEVHPGTLRVPREVHRGVVEGDPMVLEDPG